MSVPVAVPTEDDAHAAEAAVAVLVGRVAGLHRAGGGSLLECFAGVADPRRTRGIRHSLATNLGLCTAAVLSGCVTLVEITDWVTHADQELLGALGARHDRGADQGVARRVGQQGMTGLASHGDEHLPPPLSAT